jgi:hypothetical protein
MQSNPPREFPTAGQPAISSVSCSSLMNVPSATPDSGRSAAGIVLRPAPGRSGTTSR